MKRENVENPAGVRKFVRDTLGCSCPEEVFDDLVLAADTLENGRAATRTLLVGNRLLVVMLSCRDWDDLSNILPQLVRHYRQTRDGMGYNRIRLVVSCDQPALLQPAASLCFASLPEVDERMHLHLLTPADLAGVA
jgi:hypothetical protein